VSLEGIAWVGERGVEYMSGIGLGGEFTPHGERVKGCSGTEEMRLVFDV